jgi:hypothetical protein
MAWFLSVSVIVSQFCAVIGAMFIRLKEFEQKNNVSCSNCAIFECSSSSVTTLRTTSGIHVMKPGIRDSINETKFSKNFPIGPLYCNFFWLAINSIQFGSHY